MTEWSTANAWDRIADLYDEYVRGTFDVPFFVEETRDSPGAVLELTAGTGRISVALLEAGVSLTVVDRSAEMLARLRAKLSARGLSADVRQKDVCELEVGRRFALVLIPFQSLSEVLARADRRNVLARVSRHSSRAGGSWCTLLARDNPTGRACSERLVPSSPGSHSGPSGIRMRLQDGLTRQHGAADRDGRRAATGSIPRSGTPHGEWIREAAA